MRAFGGGPLLGGDRLLGTCGSSAEAAAGARCLCESVARGRSTEPPREVAAVPHGAQATCWRCLAGWTTPRAPRKTRSASSRRSTWWTSSTTWCVRPATTAPLARYAPVCVRRLSFCCCRLSRGEVHTHCTWRGSSGLRPASSPPSCWALPRAERQRSQLLVAHEPRAVLARQRSLVAPPCGALRR